ncbi:receptor-like protein 12 isoform X3 [Arachis ipaensis]|nr:receptor-like protein 12 isoform X3 [Arachis ipaensis]XP_029148559.1 receptor-like protein EIX2 isoform X2 [Arachis hypogaea]
MMSNYFLKWDYALLVVLIMLYDAGLIHGEVTCLENERQALLRFKQSIDDPWGMLSTWRGDDCCKWQGITCRNQTGHVLRLHLRGSYSHHLSGQANISTLIDLQYLQHLDLSYNDFVNSYISEHIGLFSKLKYLNISDADFAGSIPYQLGNLSQLQYLDISDNDFGGEIPPQLGKLTYLQYMDLSYNYVDGVIPYQLKHLGQLQYLCLQGNSELSGAIPFQSGDLPLLQTLKLHGDFVLESKGAEWVSNLSFLNTLDLTSMSLGNSHQWLQMIRAIPNLSLRLPNGGSTDLSSNQFEGVIPSFLLYSSWLILSRNKFSNVSSLLCQENNIGSKLGTLDLSNNQLKGSLPDCWKSLSLLLFLDLSNNNLTGKIPPSMGSLVKLEALVLRSNGFIGKLPSSLKNCTTLFLLDVSENLLSGPIPSWIGESLHQLIVLSMSGNSFSGNLSKHLCYLKKIQLLDLSRNNLSNEIPTCLKNFTAMSKKSINSTETASLIYRYNNTYYYVLYGVYISRYTFNITVTWKGVKCGFKDPELRLSSIDLSSNHFTGEIPNEIVYLVGLVSLNLSRNNLSGEIPSEIGNITSLESLDLSRNHISGTIPSSLSQIDSLGVLELSNNSLYGRIPPGRHMDTFDASSFEGNPNLCGTQLNKTCPGDMPEVKPEEPTTHDDADDNSDFYEALHMSLGFGFFTGFWGLLGPLLFWRSWRIAYLRFLNKVADYIYVTVAVYVAKFHK